MTPAQYDRLIETRLDVALGYLYFIDRAHPLASKVGRVYHHRHVASLAMGRWLVASEHVHHLVVLDDRGDYVLLWTAYPVEQDHGRRKLRRRYEASVARKG